MSRLLKWASAADAPPAGRRGRIDPIHATHTAAMRHEEVRHFLHGRADVNQRRAKRREIADSTAVRLPPESKDYKPRRAKQREVSYLSDGPALPSGVPKSVIPDAFRIVLESPLPHQDASFYSMFGDDSEWKYNQGSRQWEAVLFPSKVPAGRSDVLLLHAWVNDMVSRLKNGSEVRALWLTQTEVCPIRLRPLTKAMAL